MVKIKQTGFNVTAAVALLLHKIESNLIKDTLGIFWSPLLA